MKKKFYLAYGSNLNMQQMRFRCPNARVYGVSVIPGYELLFKGSKTGAYLTIEPRKGARVPVGVWEVTAEDELQLDRYEGYPNFYYKSRIALPVRRCRRGSIETVEAFVYIMHEERKCGMPTVSYIHTCLEGYTDFGFDEKYLNEAVKKSGVK